MHAGKINALCFYYLSLGSPLSVSSDPILSALCRSTGDLTSSLVKHYLFSANGWVWVSFVFALVWWLDEEKYWCWSGDQTQTEDLLRKGRCAVPSFWSESLRRLRAPFCWKWEGSHLLELGNSNLIMAVTDRRFQSSWWSPSMNRHTVCIFSVSFSNTSAFVFMCMFLFCSSSLGFLKINIKGQAMNSTLLDLVLKQVGSLG